MRSFDDWFDELTNGNQIWAEQISMHHKPKTFEDCARKVYNAYLAADPAPFPPMQVARGYVGNVLGKVQPDKTYSKDWVTKALEKHEQDNKEEWIPLTGEERQKRLAEFKAMIDAAPMVNAMPPISKKQAIEEGGWIPKKADPYPTTSPGELYKKERHIAWIETCYDARTKEPLPGWMEESVFNLIFDEENYDEYFKLFNPKKL